MSEFFIDYDVNVVTWFWLSLLLSLVLFVRFTRVWSVRNVDLILLLGLSPGLILVKLDHPGQGYVWLFTVSALLLLRLVFDPLFTRRPRIESNLNSHGMTILGLAIFGFMVHKVVTEPIPTETVQTVRSADRILNREDGLSSQPQLEAGPGTSLLAIPSTLLGGVEAAAARVLAIVVHLSVVLGLVLIGSRLFKDSAIGISMATLYLLLPCTAINVQSVNHVLPAALITWAILFYRKPLIAGGLLGLACGSLFFPVFLIPLWLSFYSKKGAIRFGIALATVGVILLLTLVLTSADTNSLTRQIIGSIDWKVLQFQGQTGMGFWAQHATAYRIPVFAAFVIMLVSITVWPRKKTLENLIASSAAIVLGTQFWYPRQGGAYLLWYLPLVLLVVFRPRLSNFGPPIYDQPETRTATDPDKSAPRPIPSTASRLH